MSRVIIFALTALAAALGLDNADPNTWFTETAVLAVVVASVIAFIRQSLNLDGIAVVIASVITGGGLAGVGFAAGMFAAEATLVEAIGFGLAAGWLASGGIDFIRGLLPKPEPAG